jgi:hypothetical protein
MMNLEGAASVFQFIIPHSSLIISSLSIHVNYSFVNSRAMTAF